MNKLFAYLDLFKAWIKTCFLMRISNKCNEESRGEYEMFNKQWVITKIYCEKPQKTKQSHQLFLELRSEIFEEKPRKEIFRAECLNGSDSAYWHLFCYKKALPVSVGVG